MRKILIALIVLLLASSAFAQRKKPVSRNDGFYVMLGVAQGPSFSSFFNYLHQRYQPVEGSRLKNFGKNVDFQLGYISRFKKNFAIDLGFSIYTLRSKGSVYDPYNSETISHDLRYQVGLFNITLPIIFDFAPRQKIVPYVGLGLSIFSIRLDDFFSSNLAQSEIFRDTRTTAGGHFEAGLAYKIIPRLWIDFRGRWHGGSGQLSTLDHGYLRDFSISQSVAQYSLGVDYFFR